MAFRLIACLVWFVVLASVAAAHEGHDHQMGPGMPPMTMDMSPPSPNAAAFSSSPSAVVGFLAMIVSFMAVIGRRV
ncbi:hypothetical protein C2S52_020623 [Perilla frutescens var. hirtella]|nr:hypothetical protein C2S52_020623 [Perilla frutescens var. hirtella]KAH6805246.1 hypothetical protein C2S51_030077 [Perilla frutescens var. frutescens]